MNNMTVMATTPIAPTSTIGSVISADGTTIGYRQYGEGKGLILLHGAMQSSRNFSQLAALLADAFTVYVPDRRGRGLSGPHGDHYSLSKECQDIEALVYQTGAHYIFGLSSGAVIALQTALHLPTLTRLALYEPPIPIKGQTPPNAWVSRYDQQIAQGNLAGAMVSVMRGTDDPSSIMNLIPRFLVERLLAMGINAETKEGREGEIPLKALIPTVHYDGQIPGEMEGKLESFRALQADVLLLGGTKSQKYLKAALDGLCEVLPYFRRVELQGVGHLAANNGDQPERVAQELRRFFGVPSSSR